MRLIKILLSFCVLLLLAGCHHSLQRPVNLDRDWGERKTYDYHGVKINYYEAGQGPPIILLHGLGACPYTWRLLIPQLVAEHRVFTLELKGHGLSDKPRDGRYTANDQADIIAEFIRRQELHDVVLIGHSFGGAVAVLTYLNLQEGSPGPIKGLILIGSAGYRQKLPSFIRLAQIPGGAILSKILPPRLPAALVLRKCYYNKDKITAEQIDAYAYFGNLPGTAEAVSRSAKQLVPQDIEAVTARYKNIKVPVLLIWGEEDQVTPLEVGRKFARDIPGAKLVILPRCGHIPLEEEPLATQQAIEDFLKK